MTGDIELLPLQTGDLSYLIRTLPSRTHIDLAFGIGWVSLKYDTSQPMTPAVRALGLLRGVLNENLDGGGI